MQSLEAFGKRIRVLRQEKNLTQQQLADLMFVTRKTVGNWENGNRMPDITMLSRLSHHLGVQTYELLDEIYGPDEQPIIIIVEDESVLLKGFLHIFEDTLPRADIYGFETGAEALRFAESNHVAAAFLDIELFGESGVDLAGSLMEVNPHINIIFLTGHAEYTADALDLHCSGYILKPLTPEKVQREIAHLRFPVRRLNP
ncbi:MAG: response regulator [Clostridia bacterium]|nr:response regulator [Clostridia bacterium]